MLARLEEGMDIQEGDQPSVSYTAHGSEHGGVYVMPVAAVRPHVLSVICSGGTMWLADGTALAERSGLERPSLGIYEWTADRESGAHARRTYHTLVPETASIERSGNCSRARSRL